MCTYLQLTAITILFIILYTDNASILDWKFNEPSTPKMSIKYFMLHNEFRRTIIILWMQNNNVHTNSAADVWRERHFF